MPKTRYRALVDLARTAKKGEEFEIDEEAGKILVRDKEAEPVKGKAAASTPPVPPVPPTGGATPPTS